MHRPRKLIVAIGSAFCSFILMTLLPLPSNVVQESDLQEDARANPKALALTELDEYGRFPRDNSRPAPTKADIVNAWQKRQDAVKTARFVWTEQQTHPKGWVPNPRFPEREWSAIPALLIDRSYTVTKSLSVDGNKMRYTFEIDRKEEADGVDVIAQGKGLDRGLGVRRNYSYVSVFDGQMGKTRLSSLLNSPPAAINQAMANMDGQNLDTRAILMAIRPLDPAMGHLLIDRALTGSGRRIYKGRSVGVLEERHDPSGWKTSLWIEPERGSLVSHYRVWFEQRLMVDIDIDYAEDARWGWIPSGWRVTEMMADGSRRVVAVAKVSSYNINLPIGVEEFQ